MGLTLRTKVISKRICMGSSEHNLGNISSLIGGKMLNFGMEAFFIMFFLDITTKLVISQIRFLWSHHFGTLSRHLTQWSSQQLPSLMVIISASLMIGNLTYLCLIPRKGTVDDNIPRVMRWIRKEELEKKLQEHISTKQVSCSIVIISIYQSNRYPFLWALIGSDNLQYPRLVYTTQVKSTFRACWLASLEMINQLLLICKQQKKNKMASCFASVSKCHR